MATAWLQTPFYPRFRVFDLVSHPSFPTKQHPIFPNLRILFCTEEWSQRCLEDQL